MLRLTTIASLAYYVPNLHILRVSNNDLLYLQGKYLFGVFFILKEVYRCVSKMDSYLFFYRFM